MKKIVNLLIILCSNQFGLNAQIVYAFSNPITVSKEELKSEKIAKYISNEFDTWTLKKPTEDISEWNIRNNDKNIIKKIKNEFLTKAILTVGKDEINFNNPGMDYDDENEVLQVQFLNLNPIYISITSGEEYLSFIENSQDINYLNPQFALDNNKYKLIYLELSNPDNGEEYVYDLKELANYKFQNRTLNVENLEVDFNEFKTDAKNLSITNVIYGNSDIDIDIPENNIENTDAVAVIIGNKNYKYTTEIKYAINDLNTVEKYLIKTLGFKPENIIKEPDATYGTFSKLFSPDGKLANTITANKTDVFIYYTGHGVPGLKDKKQYFMPVDAEPLYIKNGGYSFETFYDNLRKIPAKSYTIIIDACFSGANVPGIKPGLMPVEEANNIINNGVILTASSGSGTSNEYEDKKHGLFTYCFLKAIQEKSKCDLNKDRKLSYAEIFEYISDKNNSNGVPAISRKKGNEQNPNIIGSEQYKNNIILQY
jgi:hypothetical protein